MFFLRANQIYNITKSNNIHDKSNTTIDAIEVIDYYMITFYDKKLCRVKYITHCFVFPGESPKSFT